MPEMHMRPSRILQKMRAGGVACLSKLNCYDSRVVEIAAMAGFDGLWTDMEHVPNDLAVVEKQILAAKACGTDMMVRVARAAATATTFARWRWTPAASWCRTL